jgi:hypothetical protein
LETGLLGILTVITLDVAGDGTVSFLAVLAPVRCQAERVDPAIAKSAVPSPQRRVTYV